MSEDKRRIEKLLAKLAAQELVILHLLEKLEKADRLGLIQQSERPRAKPERKRRKQS